MNHDNALIGEAYYTALQNKDVAALGEYLHADVQFIGPLSTANGKENVLALTKKFTEFFKTLTIRSTFGSDKQAVVVYDIEFPPPIHVVSSVALLTFKEGCISKIQLFYDARPFS